MKVTIVFSTSKIIVAAFFDRNKAVKYMAKYNYPYIEDVEIRDAVVGGGRQGAPPPTQLKLEG